MAYRMITSAVFAGFLAGLIAALLQFFFVVPVLLEAERYETGEKTHFAAASGHSHDEAPTADAAAPAPAPGSEQGQAHTTSSASDEGIDWTRHVLTVLFSALVNTGYALVLVAAFALAERQGIRVTARQGMLWGIAGYLAVQLAPAAGLPPELPGMAAADLTLRQIWWAGTVTATAAGIWLLAFGRDWTRWLAAIALLAAPHLIGAPHPDTFVGPTPPELGSLFAGRTLGVGMAAWVCLGAIAGWLWQRETASAPEMSPRSHSA